MANERERLWRDRIAHLQAGGMTQRAYAIEHGYSENQVSYWVRRLTKPQAAPALLPVRVGTSETPSAAAIGLRSERGWTIVPDHTIKTKKDLDFHLSS